MTRWEEKSGQVDVHASRDVPGCKGTINQRPLRDVVAGLCGAVGERHPGPLNEDPRTIKHMAATLRNQQNGLCRAAAKTGFDS
jgi:hypothetical protein